MGVTSATYITPRVSGREELARLIKDFEKQMKEAAKNLEFEKAALLRDPVIELRRELVGDEEGLEAIAAAATGRCPARARAARARAGASWDDCQSQPLP